MRPVIGITPDFGATSARPGRPSLPQYELKQAYSDAVLAAGGLPIMLPYSDYDAAPQEAIELCDGLVVTGGAFDIPPELYGAKAGSRLGPLKPGRTAYEQRVLRAALAAGVPGTFDHEQKSDPRKPGHSVKVLSGSDLAAILGAVEIQVNSTHHQAVKDAGRARVCALAPDQIVEAIELPGTFALGVQWHPELLPGPEHLALYRPW